MIQGTGSGVGKSLITAALCRHFYQQGIKVAPFKSQNMALNSFVTESGGEMGRAQAYQAEACGVKPTVLMNPILLKPSGNNVSQVIVMGKVTGNRDAKNYYSRHAEHLNTACQALKDLRSSYEMVILEGAGSPAEINLKQWDLVNMRMAEMAEAPVLIVGDIDRGGVFAWMKGTYDLLSPSEKDRVCGFIINKFRGDIDLLTPGLKQFEDLVGKPILGVLPYAKDLMVDEEDAIPQQYYPALNTQERILDVAVIWLPRISNFTDVSPLAADPNVSLRYVSHPQFLGNPDLIILPGSKNSVDDLQHLNNHGLSKEIQRCSDEGSIVLGICAGFQFLGKKVCDPLHLESSHAQVEGLGYFDFTTTLQSEKITRQVKVKTSASSFFSPGLDVTGYEIHMGLTKFHSTPSVLFNGLENSQELGVVHSSGTVLGTPIHGFLDNDPLRESLLNQVRSLRNIPKPEGAFDYQAFREKQLDRLGDLVRDHLDMNRITDIVFAKNKGEKK